MTTTSALALAASAALFAIVEPVARAAPSVWVVDDGEKVRRNAVATPLARGEGNPIWRPGGEVRVFAMRNESIGLQVVVHADDRPLESVTVDLDALVTGAGESLTSAAISREDADRIVGRPIERFVEEFVDVQRASGGRTAGESLGWEQGSGPDPAAWTGEIPDALVPVELAPPWAPYPMRIMPRTNGIVWIDLNVPADQSAGVYRGTIEVKSAGAGLSSVPIELDVLDARLPDQSSGAMAYYDPDELQRRVGPGAEEHLWKILHAHRVAPMHGATLAADVRRQRDALDGSLYTRERGYFGPAPAVGDGVLSIGTYGSLGDPDDASEAKVRAIADEIAADGLFDHTDVFLYAADEDCDSPRGAAWRDRLRAATDPNLRRVRAAWTCSRDPRVQPVDVAIVDAAYDPRLARAAERLGKSVWVYDGRLPRTGTFLLDADAISPRVNGWLAAIDSIPRWFYWESTYWYDRHGRRPVDPFADAESFHNDDGDWADGDGVLLYPGRQLDVFQAHSVGFDGVIASIRLKNWRRGLEDAAYLELARAHDPARADEVVRTLIPAAFERARRGRPAAWTSSGKAFFDARHELIRIALGSGARPRDDAAPKTARPRDDAAPKTARPRPILLGAGAALVLVPLVLIAIDRRRRVTRPT
jgi:glycosyl hydrolase family 123